MGETDIYLKGAKMEQIFRKSRYGYNKIILFEYTGIYVNECINIGINLKFLQNIHK